MKSAMGWISAAFILSICLATTSCSARRVRSESASNELLFPLGTYKHGVKIKTAPIAEQPARKFSFDGIVQISALEIKVVVLSPFGITLFKLHEDRKSGNIELENFIDAFKGQESKIQDYYVVLKLLLTAPADLNKSEDLHVVRRYENGMPDEIVTGGALPKISFVFKKYDNNGIPERIEIQHPKFSIDIKVTGYDV